MLDLFYWFWFALDILFTGIENMFISCFPYIPISAIPFVVSIFGYSLVAFLNWIILDKDTGLELRFIQIAKYFFIVLLVLIVIWRLGVISLVPSGDIYGSISAIFISAIYCVLFGSLIVAFFILNSNLVQSIVLVLNWICLLIITLFIAPITNEMALSENTIPSLLIISFIFAVPKSMLYYKQSKTEKEIKHKTKSTSKK